VSATNGGGPRRIDPSVGALQGEGAAQRVGDEPAEQLAPFDVYDRPADSSFGEDPTYYDRPVLKEPVWIWTVPMYFYVGGSAGCAATLAAVASASDSGELENLVDRARWIGAVGAVAGTGLLIADLGRPERFLNMLRVFRPTSPMSVGSWNLAAATPLFLSAATLGGRAGTMGRLGRAAGALGGLLGIPLSSYTAALLSNTAVPLWEQTRREMPMLFAGSGMAGAASLLDFADLSPREQRVVRRFGVIGQVAELVSAVFLERRAERVERVAAPLKEGRSGSLWKTAKVLTAASLALHVLARRSGVMTKLAGAFGTAGSIAVRFAFMDAGKASASDPRATFHSQRAGLGAVEVTGRSATSESAHA
jgi:formate-dependent nitrite reductase membrane component NrfD